LRKQLLDNERIGFIVIDGSCTSFHLLVGSSKETLFKKEVVLPKKHSKGSQSQNKLGRTRNWYTLKITKLAMKYFIDSETNRVNVKAIIVSGFANIKKELVKKLDPRIHATILNTYTVQSGGEAGFHQTLKLCKADLKDCRFTEENSCLSEFFQRVSDDSGLYVFSPEECVYALEAGAVPTLVVWAETSMIRIEMVGVGWGTWPRFRF
jgi:peptide chain release factor subunit 1